MLGGWRHAKWVCMLDKSLTKIFHRITWNIHVSVSMELHGGSMVSTIENPWVYPEFIMVNTMGVSIEIWD